MELKLVPFTILYRILHISESENLIAESLRIHSINEKIIHLQTYLLGLQNTHCLSTFCHPTRQHHPSKPLQETSR